MTFPQVPHVRRHSGGNPPHPNILFMLDLSNSSAPFVGSSIPPLNFSFKTDTESVSSLCRPAFQPDAC